MQRITLYTLQSETVTQYCKDELFFTPFGGIQHVKDRCKEGSDRFIEAQFKTIGIPVERFLTNNPNGTRDEYLVAFDPEIRKILCINENNLKLELKDVKDKLDGANKTNDMLVKYKNDLLVEVEELNSFYQTVQTLSFWYKLLFLFTGKIRKGETL